MTARTRQDDEKAMQWAIALHQGGRLSEAASIYEEILRSRPSHLNATFFLGLSYAQQNNLDLAAKFFGKAARLNPAFVDAHFNCGLVFHSMGNLQKALECYNRTIRLKADHADAIYNRGVVLNASGRHEEALQSLDLALRVKPNHAEAYSIRGVVLSALKRFEEALQSCDRAILLSPNYAEAYSNRGAALRELKRFEEAVQSCDQAIRLKPVFAEAHINRGIALNELRHFEAALQSYDLAIRLDPNKPDVHNYRGAILSTLKRFEEALQSYDRAIRIKTDYAEAWAGRGAALSALNRLEEALQAYDRAIQIKKNYAEAHNVRSIALCALNRFDEALQSCDRAIRIKPDYAEAYANRGVALRELKRFEEAMQSYDRAIQLAPHYEFLMGDVLRTQMNICDWGNYGSSVAELRERLSRGEKSAPPFFVLALLDSLDLQRRASDIWVRAKSTIGGEHEAAAPLPSHRRIRIGYFSADFRNHAVAVLMAGLFEEHDRSRFELIAFSLGPDADDDMRTRLKVAFDRFIDVRAMSDRDVVLLARNLEIDIAVDLNGLTRDARTSIFAMRAAPIQVNYLGYPGTMGADYIDYLIADHMVIPAVDQSHYVEKIVYLPNTYQPNDRKRPIAGKVFKRSELCLPQDGFVFCCFNNNYKITPDVFDSWMRILGHVGGSVLWLLQDSEIAAVNLRKEASARGVDPDRLVFASRMTLPDHLARHRMADLFLDTLPYNAHTTASDALWAGLPVLTQIGQTFAGRVAASLLNAAGLPELITTTRDAYEALAVELATNPAKLASIKQKISDNRLTTPLFDTALFTRHIEAAYTAMYERHHAGLPPDHLHVPH